MDADSEVAPLVWLDTATDCLFCGAPTGEGTLEIHATDCPMYLMSEEDRRKRGCAAYAD